MRALLVEDDPSSVKLVRMAIEPANFTVEAADTGEEALEFIKLYDFDVAIVDLRLPDLDGSTVVRRMRSAQASVPVMMLSAVTANQEKVKALIAGADDYVTKPFDREELRARLQAIVRRSKGHPTSRITIGRMTIDLATRTVEIDGQALNVTSKEYSILELLALRKGMTLSKETFLDHLYGGMDEPEQKIIDVFICKLRKKIAAITKDDPPIATVWGRGYMLKDPEAVPGLAEDAEPFLGADIDLRGLVERELMGLAASDGAPERHRQPNELDMLLLDLLP